MTLPVAKVRTRHPRKGKDEGGVPGETYITIHAYGRRIGRSERVPSKVCHLALAYRHPVLQCPGQHPARTVLLQSVFFTSPCSVWRSLVLAGGGQPHSTLGCSRRRWRAASKAGLCPCPNSNQPLP